MTSLDALLIPLEKMSKVELLTESGEWQHYLDALDAEQRARLLYAWEMWSRPNQRVPQGDDWRVWMFRAGRGSGKTLCGAQTCRIMIEHTERIALVAPTSADVRDVIIEGESGLMNVFPPDLKPEYEPSKRRVTFHNGAKAYAYSGEEPERLRGPQHGWAWIDEPASMRLGPDVVSNMLLGLRLGQRPWALITGTPKPLRWMRELSERVDTVTTTGSTYENLRNLAPGFIRDIIERYEGTRLGRQELHAEFLDDVVGALWTPKLIDESRIVRFDMNDPWNSLIAGVDRPVTADRRPWRVVVAVDPPAETAECGIVVVAAPTQGKAGVDHAVVLDDMSLAGRPEQWGAQVVAAARKWNAERVLVESNQGGDMVRATIQAVEPNLRVEKIRASISKAARAEPVSALYERGFVHHSGFLPLLEEQLCGWVPGISKSPDRLDALVHGIASVLTEKPTIRASVRSATNRRIGV